MLSTSRSQAGILVALIAGASFACDDAQPTEVAASPLVITPELAAGVTTVLEDARGRILPGLENARVTMLRESLEQVSAAIAAWDRAALMATIAEADAALADLGAAQDGAAAAGADLDAVRLALSAARLVLTDGTGGPSR